MQNVSVDALLNNLADRIVERLEGRLNAARPAQTSRLLTLEGAATYLSRTVPAVRHLIAQGKLPTVRIDGRICLDVRDLDRAIEDAKVA